MLKGPFWCPVDRKHPIYGGWATESQTPTQSHSGRALTPAFTHGAVGQAGVGGAPVKTKFLEAYILKHHPKSVRFEFLWGRSWAPYNMEIVVLLFGSRLRVSSCRGILHWMHAHKGGGSNGQRLNRILTLVLIWASTRKSLKIIGTSFGVPRISRRLGSI